MTERIVFELNGKTQTVEVAPDTPLLYVLRNELGLNNPHFGCGLAQCGACTVHVDGAAARSCSVPVSAAAGTKGHDLGRARHP
jgi:nicotinate dehydrogenase subunit A